MMHNILTTFFSVLEFELRVLHFIGRHSTTCAMTTAPSYFFLCVLVWLFFPHFFSIRVLLSQSHFASCNECFFTFLFTKFSYVYKIYKWKRNKWILNFEIQEKCQMELNKIHCVFKTYSFIKAFFIFRKIEKCFPWWNTICYYLIYS
jgi:hypothetical protein